MKLSPLDVEQHQFARVLRGYQPVEVERYLTFIARALTERDEIIRGLEKRLSTKDDDLEGLKSREEEVRGAMLLTQRAVEDLKGQAIQEAQAIVQHAETRAETLLRTARLEAASLENAILALRTQREKLAEDLGATLRHHAHTLKLSLREEMSNVDEMAPHASSGTLDLTLEPLHAEAMLDEMRRGAADGQRDHGHDKNLWTGIENSSN